MDKLRVAIINLSNDTNVGGLIRTSDAAGVEEVFIVGRRKWNKSASTGSHLNLNIMKMRSDEEFIQYCFEQNYNIISVEIGENSENIFDFKYPKNTILVIGNEGTGVSKKILDSSYAKVYIPQYGDVECLNAAIAGSISIYDWIRKNSKLNENKAIGQKFIKNETK